MKAAVRLKYGPPEILRVNELSIPVATEGEILVRVHATTVNRTDCAILWGRPFIMRFFTGLLKPSLEITGTDFAGQVEALGKNVKLFKVGDRVMGFGDFGLRSHAQYLTLLETKAVVIIPDQLSYDQAAACLEGAYYALDCVNMVKPKPGQRALVYGATGAIGLSMVQFLKFYGVSVTAICGGENQKLVTSLGADKVIDYKTTDFTKDNDTYDFIFDAVGKTAFSVSKHLLKKKGIYISAEPNLFLIISTALYGDKKVMFRPPKSIKEALNFIKGLIERGSFRPVIDRHYSLDKIAEAFEYVATGQKIGNVIITMDA